MVKVMKPEIREQGGAAGGTLDSRKGLNRHHAIAGRLNAAAAVSTGQVVSLAACQVKHSGVNVR